MLEDSPPKIRLSNLKKKNGKKKENSSPGKINGEINTFSPPCIIPVMVMREQRNERISFSETVCQVFATFHKMFRELDTSLEMLLLFCRNAASIYCSNRESHLRDSASRKAAYKKFKGALVLKLTSR